MVALVEFEHYGNATPEHTKRLNAPGMVDIFGESGLVLALYVTFKM